MIRRREFVDELFGVVDKPGLHLINGHRHCRMLRQHCHHPFLYLCLLNDRPDFLGDVYLAINQPMSECCEASKL